VVAIRVRVPAFTTVGQELLYRICVENRSKAAAHHVLVRNPLPANATLVKATPEPTANEPELQWLLGTLPPGACQEIVLVLMPTGPGEIKNCARVQFEHGQCVSTKVAPAVVPFVPVPPVAPVVPIPAKPGEAQLNLSMTGPKQRYVNMPATYHLTLSNPGTTAATNVLLFNFLPAKSKLVSATGGGQLQADQLTWKLDQLAAGASKTFQVVLRAEAAGELCNRASVLADGGLAAHAEICTTFKGVSSLVMELSHSKNPVPVGEETTYTMIVRNQGTAEVTNIQVKVLVPDEMAVAMAGGPVEHQLGKRDPKGQPLVYEPLKSLAAGEKKTYQVRVKALRPGDVRFKVELTADQLQGGGPVHEEDSTTIYAPKTEPPAPAGEPVRRQRR
jgi:uncharacterized repeat protein (TIGR01451 family)